MKKLFIVTALVIGSAFNSANVASAAPGRGSVDSVIQRSLNFLQDEQFSKNSGYYSPGEFPVNMKSYLIPSMVGLGRLWARPSHEPTAFATASIMTLLSEAYLLNPDLKSVPSILHNGLQSFDLYREGDIFHYYPKTEFKGRQIHVPRDTRYVPRAMIGLALVPPDADTTSVSFTAMAFYDQIFNNKKISEFQVPTETLKTLNLYRDVNRDPHLYNRLNGGVKNSGAYMTWLWDENAPSSSFFKSMNDSYKHGYRIVFGRNDVDCVVNANVLRLLTLTENTSEEGYKKSCEFLNQSILQTKALVSQAKYCGLYYPNTFGALYSISNVYKAGASCLEKSSTTALKMIIERQNEDGSWSNDEGIGREDRVQSTALALGAILNYIDLNDRYHAFYVQRGMDYLISRAKRKSSNKVYWEGEVFFSAGPAARNTILWRSDAYTTALVLLSLQKSKMYLNGEVPQ